MNTTIGGAGARSDHRPGLWREAINPIAGEDGLTGLVIGPKASPVALGFICFVGNGSFDDQYEGGEASCNGAVKRLEEVFAVCVGEHWVVEIHLGNPGGGAGGDIPPARPRFRGPGARIATTAGACGN